jgi:hypothetical protein
LKSIEEGIKENRDPTPVIGSPVEIFLIDITLIVEIIKYVDKARNDWITENASVDPAECRFASPVGHENTRIGLIHDRLIQ